MSIFKDFFAQIYKSKQIIGPLLKPTSYRKTVHILIDDNIIAWSKSQYLNKKSKCIDKSKLLKGFKYNTQARHKMIYWLK